MAEHDHVIQHDIDEALQIADRVVMLSSRPATIRLILSVLLPRPRDLNSPDYLDTRDRILSALGVSVQNGILPDTGEPLGVSPRTTASMSEG